MRIGIGEIDFGQVYSPAWSGTIGTRECAEIIARKTGIPMDKLRNTMISGLTGLIDSENSAQNPRTTGAWITKYLRGLEAPGLGEFCSKCLLEAPQFKLNWRISLFVSCPVHHCLLKNRCESCNRRFAGLAHLKNVILSDTPDVVTMCPLCGGRLSIGEKTTPILPAVAALEAIHRDLIRNRSCLLYFSALHSILSFMARHRRFSRVALPVSEDGSFGGFESCDSLQRQYLLCSMIKLFKKWPSSFLSALQSTQTAFNLHLHDDLPPWLEAVGEIRRQSHDQTFRVWAEFGCAAKFWSAANKEGWHDAAQLLYHGYATS